MYSFRIFVFATLIFLAASISGIQQPLAESYRVYGVVSGDVLHIRAWPSPKSRKVGSIPPYGQGVERLGPCKEHWCKISYRGMTGWASMKYLTPEASSGSSYRVQGIRYDDVLFIRAWPSSKSKKIGSVPPDGRNVNKLGPCKGNWCKISYRGITGWSSMKYLVADGAARPAPAPAPIYVQPAPPPKQVPGNRRQSGGWGGIPESIPAPAPSYREPPKPDYSHPPDSSDVNPPHAPPPSADMFEGL